jgi:hypothetical protein
MQDCVELRLVEHTALSASKTHIRILTNHRIIRDWTSVLFGLRSDTTARLRSVPQDRPIPSRARAV